jgi:hypothetical protein
MFISMRTILFNGGLTADKHLFASVNEDPATKGRRCHIFRAGFDLPVNNIAFG